MRRRSPAPPLCHFKVYPGRNNPLARERRCYFVVEVYARVASAWATVRRASVTHPDILYPQFGACVLTEHLYRLPSGRWGPRLGLILFGRTQTDPGAVVHESLHAAVTYLRRVKPSGLRITSPRTTDEEDLAHAVETVSRQIGLGFRRFGVW